MPGRSIIEAIHFVRRLVEHHRDRMRDLHVVFIDLEKSCDKVPREALWKGLEDRGASVAYMKAIKDKYDGTKIKVRTVKGDSKHFLIMMGLHQRSTLSPFSRTSYG